MKREVRQRCGFGCVVCGIPLITYEHMVDYAIVQEHEALNLTLLCAEHQRESTNGLLSRKQVQDFDANPYCLRTGASHPFGLNFELGFEDPVIKIGSDHFTAPPPAVLVPIVIDMFRPIVFNTIDSNLLLSLHLQDEHNRMLVRIEDNEVVLSPTAWDITFEGGRLQIRTASRQISLSILFNPPNEVIVERMTIHHNAVSVVVAGGTATYLDAAHVPFATSTGNWFSASYGYVIGRRDYSIIRGCGGYYANGHGSA